MTNFITPVGRIVQCALEKPLEAKLTKEEIAAGKKLPPPVYLVKLAIDKKDPKTAEFIAAMKEERKKAWGEKIISLPKFSSKIADGDTDVDAKGNKLNEKEGYAGSYIVSLKSQFAPFCCTKNDVNTAIDKAAIKAGYYVRVSGSTAPNKRQDQPGMYMNLNKVLLVAIGPEIKGTQTSGREFEEDNYNYDLPAGATEVTNVAPATGDEVDYDFINKF